MSHAIGVPNFWVDVPFTATPSGTATVLTANRYFACTEAAG
jgi:hypothetical protein